MRESLIKKTEYMQKSYLGTLQIRILLAGDEKKKNS